MALKDVIGHERPIEILKRSLKAGRLSHAYLFVGEEGIGKFFTAINLAKVLNCERSGYGLNPDLCQDEEIEACDNCPSCIEIDKGIHPDVFVIKPEGNQINDQIKIDQIRMAEGKLALRALKGRKKVLIIDKAHTMNTSSANALLKSLEEPPEGTIIILISSATELLPSTILSRCQRLPFGLLGKKVIESLLLSKGFEKDDACLTASLSDGRIGRAMQGYQEMPLEEREDFLTLFNYAKEPFYNILPMAEEIAKGKEGKLEEILGWGEVWLRDLTVFKVTQNQDFIINQDKKKEIEETTERLSLDQLQASFKVIQNTKRFVTLRANKHLALEVMMIRLAEIL